MSIGDSIDGVIVEGNSCPIGGEAHVKFNPFRPVGCSQPFHSKFRITLLNVSQLTLQPQANSPEHQDKQLDEQPPSKPSKGELYYIHCTAA